MKVYYKHAIGNECSQCKYFICSIKDFTRGLVYKVKTMGDLKKLSHEFNFWRNQN